MNYREAMDYREKVAAYDRNTDSDITKELLKRLGNPHKGLKLIRIAGINGKSSVLTLLSTVLKNAGYGVGGYVSSHLFEYRERFQIQGKPIAKAHVARLMEQAAIQADAMEREGLPHPTVSEMEMAMSLLLFREKHCELVIWEADREGERDVAAIIKNPLLCIVPPIDVDEAEIRGKANKKLKEQQLSYKENKNITLSLCGQYQLVNGAVVLKALKALEQSGYPVKERAIRKGMAEAFLPGRFQVFPGKPIFIADGAHNEAGALALRKSLEYYFPNKRILYIMGMLRDEECEGVIVHTHSLAEYIITVSAGRNCESLSALELAQMVSARHLRVTVADSVEEAVELAFLLADKDTVIVAFGSLTYLGDCIRAANRRKEK